MGKMEKKVTKTVNHSYRPNAVSEEQSAEPPALNFDDWEVIAGHLDLVNLINLADVCTDARDAARLIFKRKYPSPELNVLVNATDVETYFWNRMTVVHNRFEGGDVTSLKLLRNFGDLISKLEINTGIATMRNDNRSEMVIEYANNFCNESRKKLIVRKYLPILMEKPLKNVVEMLIDSNKYSGVKFYTLTQNIPSIEIRSDRVHLYLKKKMPHLKKLKIITTNYNDIDGIGDKHIVRLMDLNTQIEELHIENHRFHFEMKSNALVFYFKKITEFIPPSMEMIRPEKFETLQFTTEVGIYFRLNLVDFLLNFINLKCLNVQWKRVLDGNWPKVFSSMPKLQKLGIFVYSVDFDGFSFLCDQIIFLVASHQRNITVLTFYFDASHYRDVFFDFVNRPRFTQSWFVHLNGVGTNEFYYPVTLDLIPVA